VGLYNVSLAAQAVAPIYDQLIAERGDLPAIAARTAERTRREAAEILDFSSLGAALGAADAAADTGDDGDSEDDGDLATGH
jgi:hypothetical protein